MSLNASPPENSQMYDDGMPKMDLLNDQLTHDTQ